MELKQFVFFFLFIFLYLFLIGSKLDYEYCVHSRSYFMPHIMWTNDLEIWRVCLCNLDQTGNLKDECMYI